MKILKRIGLVILVLVVAVVGIAYALPGHYRVERSVVIKAKPEAVFPHVNTLKNWPEWTAWTTAKYPDMKVTFTGPESGVGAAYSWDGPSTGKGMLKLTKSEPAKAIAYDLNFEDGKYLSTGQITIVPAGDGVKVTWSNEGELGYNPINRYFGLLMDKMMGPDFEEGLNNLKKKVEGS